MRLWRCMLPGALATVGVTLMSSPALAASRFTLLSVNDLRQFVSAGYNYQDSLSVYGTRKISSTNHGFNESYSISAGYSILHPRLLRGDANIGLVSNQELASNTSEGDSSSGNNRIFYSVNGIILDRKPYPISFSVQSSTLMIRPTFSRAYTVDSQGQNVSLHIQNKYLPVTFSYGRNESTTSGLDDDTKHTMQTAAVTIIQSTGDLSSTRLSLSQTYDQQILLGIGTTDNRNEFSGDLTNALHWENLRGLHRRLDTSYSYRDQNGSYPGSQSNFGSTLGWQLGKALESRLTYSQSSNRNEQSSNRMQNVTGSLTHRYLKSLQTNVGGSFAKGSYNDGSDISTSWNAGVAYTKELPMDSRIGLDYGYRYMLQDRSRTNVNLNVFEPVTLSSLFPQFIDLAAQNIDSSTIAFYRDAGQTLPFTDFSVVLSGVQTRILINSDPGVPILYQKYSYQQSPNIKYSTFGHSIGWLLSLLGNKHVLHVNYSWSDVQILAGADPNSTLGGSTHLRAGLESHLSPHTLSLNYTSDRNVYQDIQNIDAIWTHSMGAANASLLTKAENRYSWYADKGKDTASSQKWDNTALISTAYSRLILQNIKGTLTLGYFNLLTSSVSSNKFSLELGLAGNIGRTDITLDSASNWTFSSSGSAHNQSVTLNARRSF